MTAALLSLLFAIAPAKKALIDELMKAMSVPAASAPQTADAYDRAMNDQQLRDTIAFFRSDAGKSFLKAQSLVASANEKLDEAAERAKTRSTMADLRTLAVATEAYQADESTYPDAKDLDALQQLLAPAYILRMPRTDGWGTQYAYVVSENGHTYRFVSAGPDKTFSPSSLVIGAKADASSDDLVFENGAFVQFPAWMNRSE